MHFLDLIPLVDTNYNLPYIDNMARLKKVPNVKENTDSSRAFDPVGGIRPTTPLQRRQYALRIGHQGRIVIPAPMRKALGLKPGDILVGWIEEGKVILQTRRTVQEELWAMFKKVKRSLSEELIAERREEARKEAEQGQ